MTDRDQRATRDAGTLMALLCLIGGSVLFIAFAAMVMPQLLGLFLVVGLFLGAVAFHYLIWGWWLTAALKMDDADSRAADSSSTSVEPGSPEAR